MQFISILKNTLNYQLFTGYKLLFYYNEISLLVEGIEV